MYVYECRYNIASHTQTLERSNSNWCVNTHIQSYSAVFHFVMMNPTSIISILQQNQQVHSKTKRLQINYLRHAYTYLLVAFLFHTSKALLIL